MIICRKDLIGEVSSGVAIEQIPRQFTEGHDGEEDERDEGKEEMHDTDSEGNVSRIVECQNVNSGGDVDGKEDEEEGETFSEGLSSGKLTRDIGPFSAGGNNHDERGDSTTETAKSPLRCGRRVGRFGLFVVLHQERRGAVGRIVPKHGDMDDPNSVKVGHQMEP
jgi:hypothetical protein